VLRADASGQLTEAFMLSTDTRSRHQHCGLTEEGGPRSDPPRPACGRVVSARPAGSAPPVSCGTASRGRSDGPRCRM
jgi:hypothetical protein